MRSRIKFVLYLKNQKSLKPISPSPLKLCEAHRLLDPGQLVTKVGECAAILKAQEEAVSHDLWILHLLALVQMLPFNACIIAEI